MPASLPGSTLVQNQANPSLGRLVTFDALSGPKNSPFDAAKIDYVTVPPVGIPVGWTAQRIPLKVNDPLNCSTGGLATGVGFGSPPVIGPVSHPLVDNSVWGLHLAGFTDDYKPGISTPVPADASNSRFMYVGGGRSVIANGTGPNGNGYPPGWFTSQPSPYTAGFGIAAAGNGGLRDAGAGPAFTGHGMKAVTATADVINGADVEAGWANRSGVTIHDNESVFGVGAAALAVPTLEDDPPPPPPPIP
jgi:hypothetical protein